MLCIKKIVATMFTLGSFISYAGMMGSLSEHPTIKKWSIGAKALYLQDSLGALDFPVFVPINDSMDQYFNQTSAWNWGYMLEGAYQLTTSNDININWYHQSANNKQVVGGNTSALVNASGLLPVQYVLKPKWDAVNLELGYRVDYNPSLDVRYHAGLEYVNIIYKRYNYRLIDGWGLVNRLYTYNGFGPRAGIDASYSLGYKLSAYAKAGMGLYAGSSRFVLDLSNLPIAGKGKEGSTTVVVPELEAKLGANYVIPSINISLDAGWMWINYIDPLTYGDSGQVRSANFGLQGLYFGLNWAGDLA